MFDLSIFTPITKHCDVNDRGAPVDDEAVLRLRLVKLRDTEGHSSGNGLLEEVLAGETSDQASFLDDFHLDAVVGGRDCQHTFLNRVAHLLLGVMLELRKDACQYLLGLVLSHLVIDLDVESRPLSSVMLAQSVRAIGKSFLDQVVFILET